jgi:hypothetical protein
MLRSRAPFAAALTLALAACTGSAGSASPESAAPESAAPVTSISPAVTDILGWQEGQPTPDGCAVISPEEVSAASGFTIVRTAAMQSGEAGCGYYDKDGLVMSTRFHAREPWGQRHWAAEMARAPLEVQGVADTAMWIERARQLWMWKGDELLMMGIGRIGEDPVRLELAKQLGPVLAAKFP